jgi:threonine dehydratase
MTEPSFSAVQEAAGRLRRVVRRTPVLTCRTLDRLCDAELRFKCENFQGGGAFKLRGAANAILSLPEAEARRGVATHSSGNHAQALALAARARGIAAHVVMPTSAPAVKQQAVADYGARIIPCAPTLAAREETLARVLAETGAVFIHPYDDARVIAGQGTAALELLQECGQMDAVLAPVGGGGLLSGTVLAAKGLQPATHVIGVEPAAADDACRSLAAGHIIPAENPVTIADGLRTSLGRLTFPIIQSGATRIVTVSEPAIVRAMRLIWERMKILVEPSGAVVLAALLENRAEVPGRRLGLILSGGNVDLDRLPWLEAGGSRVGS